MMAGNAFSRRAEEFDALLTGDASAPAREKYADLLEVVDALAAVPAPAARPVFVADLRERLVAAAEEMPAPRTDRQTALRLTPSQRRGSRERRMAAVLGGFAVVAATGSMALASQSALPGDVLYPVKRAIENAHANLQSSAESKASVLLHNADTRLSEVEDLSARHQNSDADEISSTLQAFKDQTNQATDLAISDFSDSGDDTALSDVRDFASSSMNRLTALDDDLPAASRPALIAAAQTVRQADTAAYDACPTCTPSTLTQLPSFATKSLTSALHGSRPASSTPNTTRTKPGSKPGSSGPAQSQPSSAPQGSNSNPGAPAAGGQPSVPLPSVPSVPVPTHGDGSITGGVGKVVKHLIGGDDGQTSDGGSDQTVIGGVTSLLGLD